MRRPSWIAATAIIVLGLGFGHAGCYTSGTPGGTGAGGTSSSGASIGGAGGGAAGSSPTDSGTSLDSGDAQITDDAGTCVDSRGCAVGVCDPKTKRCVDCVTNADCLDTQHRCANHECVTIVPCNTDQICKPFGLICDSSRAYCVDCLIQENCASGEACIDGLCV
jgi:hypothetical protein